MRFYLRGRSKAAESNTVRIGVRIGGVDYPSDISKTFTSTAYDISFVGTTWSGSSNNPATGNPFTVTEVTSAEWYLELTSAGATGVEISWFWGNPYYSIPVQQLREIATFMVVNEGDAPTDNGAVPSASTFLSRLGLLGVG